MLGRLRDRARERRSTGDDVWLIVGLGNPGPRYERTRHNVGFMVVDELARRLPGGATRDRFQAAVLETRHDGRRVILAKPQTFMNESGQAVAQLVRWYKVPLERLLVIYDDLDLPFGTIRLRAEGSDGGHNGLASVQQHLQTQAFPRLRVGISRPASGSTVPYVLSPFSPDEQRQLPEVIALAADAALHWMEHGIVSAMNTFNRRAASRSAS